MTHRPLRMLNVSDLPTFVKRKKSDYEYSFFLELLKSLLILENVQCKMIRLTDIDTSRSLLEKSDRPYLNHTFKKKQWNTLNILRNIC